MSKAKKPLLSNVVKPLIRSNDEKHLLEEIFEGPTSEMPEMKSIGYMKLGKGPNSWVSYVMTTRGTEVLSIEIDEPNLRSIAEESAKINFVQSFVDREIM